MKIEHLEERIGEYLNSIKTVVEKRIYWNSTLKPLVIRILKKAEKTYLIGWKVQELNWIHTNEAVNITFNSFPPGLIETTNQIPSYQFLQGGSLVFSQKYNGDVEIFVIFPQVDSITDPSGEMKDLGTYAPNSITEKLIIEKLDDFLREMIRWEVPLVISGVGFKKTEN
ncbi:hypothetical protein [Salegentibacter chungangensis]|uniref:Uncharacterized protein n=1 Tax=Salegentibacter chungangensis TaxID=1335724 RepID=A0ABW3NTF1_9FLAO